MKQQTKRIGIVVGLAVLCIVLALVIAAQLSVPGYHKQVTAFASELTSAHEAQKVAFDLLPPTATNVDAARVMQQSEERLQKVLDERPKRSALLSLPFVAADDRQRDEALQAAAQDLINALKDIREFVAYSEGVHTVLDPALSHDADTPTGQKALAADWADVPAGLERLHAPKGAEANKKALLDEANEVNTIATATVAAYEQDDIGGFMEHSQHLQAKMGGMLDALKGIPDLGKTYDDALTKTYDRLGESL